MQHKYLFVLCPPYSGSTVLWTLLANSPNVSALSDEGQFLEGVRHIMRKDTWNPNNKFPWPDIKRVWEESWDHTKPILLEKSPPNLIRAFEIEEHFPSSYFIVMMRDPYANCEGISRRHKDKGLSPVEAAEAWVMRAQHQIKNINGLKNVLSFTYESMTENIIDIRDQLVNFIPELQHIDVETRVGVGARSIIGANQAKMMNYNAIKIDNLTTKDLLEINSVLENYPEVMDYFGYEYIYPTIRHSIRHKLSKPKLLASKFKHKFKRRIMR